MIVYNDRGWTSLFRYPGPSPMSPDDVIRATVTPLVGTGVAVYQFCGGGGYAANYPSKFLADEAANPSATTDSIQQWKALETLRQFKRLNVDPLALIAKACRQNGIACQFSLPMGGADLVEKGNPWFAKHPGALLPDGRLDYASPQAVDFRKAQVEEVLQRPELAGIDLDFTHFQPSFSPGKHDAARTNLTSLVRDLRKITRQAGKTLSAIRPRSQSVRRRRAGRRSHVGRRVVRSDFVRLPWATRRPTRRPTGGLPGPTPRAAKCIRRWKAGHTPCRVRRGAWPPGQTAIP